MSEKDPPENTDLAIWQTVKKCVELLLPLTDPEKERILRTVRAFFDLVES